MSGAMDRRTHRSNDESSYSAVTEDDSGVDDVKLRKMAQQYKYRYEVICYENRGRGTDIAI
jgi:hypothetical protein